MPDGPKTFTCDQCGGTFDKGQSDEEADAEALQNFGVRGDAPDMATVCDDCYREVIDRLIGLRDGPRTH